MYKSKFEELNTIIDNTKRTMRERISEVNEITNFANMEYNELEEEFLKLKIETEELIKKVDLLKIDYIEAKKKLRKANIDPESSFTVKEINDFYEKTDELRKLLSSEEEKETAIRIRRNELELHLKTVRRVQEKSEKIKSNFEMAFTVIAGDLEKLTKDIGDIEHTEIWGMKVIEAQEKEKQRIARDLHDGPAQNLTNLLIKTEVCLRFLENDVNKARKEMTFLKTLLRETINDTRNLIYNLRPMSIDDLGLVPALERHIDKVIDDSGMNIEFITRGIKYYRSTLYEESVVLTIFRIVQESLSNCVKYSKASKVIVALSFFEDKIELSVSDDGIGFNSDDIRLELDLSSGFGISMMKERANLLRSKFEINSELDKGTTVNLVVFLNKKNNKKEENNEKD